jgi:hypothetical protein
MGGAFPFALAFVLCWAPGCGCGCGCGGAGSGSGGGGATTSAASCAAPGGGSNHCGAAGESCCTSLGVPGGTCYRTYGDVSYADGGVLFGGRRRPHARRARIRSAARRAASFSPSTVVPACSASILRSFSSSVPSKNMTAPNYSTYLASATPISSSPSPAFVSGLRRRWMGYVADAESSAQVGARGGAPARAWSTAFSRLGGSRPATAPSSSHADAVTTTR